MSYVQTAGLAERDACYDERSRCQRLFSIFIQQHQQQQQQQQQQP